MELRHLRYFVTVAAERNFTRAAEKLHMAQPPLSRQIRQLEDDLGVSLIERGSRPATLTEPGRLVYEQAVQVLERVEEIRNMVRRLRQADQNRFSIGFVSSTLYGKLPDVLRRYRAARPDVELTLLELTSIEQVSALKDGRIDVGFGRIAIADPALKRQLLRNERMIAALPPGFPGLAREGGFRLEDLAGSVLIVYPKSPRPSYADQVLSLYRQNGLKPAALIEVRELQTALGLVAAEAGICIVPAGVERLRRDGVVYRPLDDEHAVSPIIMTFRRNGKSAEVALLMKLIRDMYRKEGIAFGA